MKSELKEIQESNLLADKIEGFLIKVKQKLPLIIGVVVVGTVLLLASGIYKTWSDSISAKGWSALYFSDTEASDLESIAEDFPNTPPGLWARMAAGDSHLAQGVQSVNTNRDVADKHYEKAIAEYEKVVTSASEGFLLARSEFQAEASKRATWLDSSEAEEFFAWYKTNRTTAPAIPPMSGGVPSVPGAPVFDLPGMPSAPSQPESATPPANNSADTPTTAAPAETKLDEVKPLELTPAGTETPAKDLPAATTPEVPK